MLGMLINTSLPWAPNTWKLWVDHIMKNKETYGFKRAAMIHENGATASATSGFVLPPQDIVKMKSYFKEKSENDSLTLQGKTYIIKSVTETQIVAFNGHKYFIICKSKSMYIVTLCESRTKCGDAAHWLKKLTKRLIEKDY